VKLVELVVGMVQANCIIGYDEMTLEGFVLDPGGEEARILREIEARKLHITHILCTHGHFDHIMAVSRLKAATGAAVYVHELDAPKLTSAVESLYVHFAATEEGFEAVTPDVLLYEGDVIETAGEKLTVLHTPGHTVGGVCYDTGSILLSGDTVFSNSCGRVDFPDGDVQAMYASLRRIAALEGERMVYAGHGEPAALSEIRLHNPYVRQAVARA